METCVIKWSLKSTLFEVQRLLGSVETRGHDNLRLVPCVGVANVGTHGFQPGSHVR